jgi:hypothetical protein
MWCKFWLQCYTEGKEQQRREQELSPGPSFAQILSTFYFEARGLYFFWSNNINLCPVVILPAPSSTYYILVAHPEHKAF